MENNPFEVGKKSKTTTNISKQSKTTNNRSTTNSSKTSSDSKQTSQNSSWDGEIRETGNNTIDFTIKVLTYLEQNKWMAIIVTTMFLPFLDFLVIPAAIFGDEIIDFIIKQYKDKK